MINEYLSKTTGVNRQTRWELLFAELSLQLKKIINNLDFQSSGLRENVQFNQFGDVSKHLQKHDNITGHLTNTNVIS